MSSQFIATLHSKHIFWDSWDNIFFLRTSGNDHAEPSRQQARVAKLAKTARQGAAVLAHDDLVPSDTFLAAPLDRANFTGLVIACIEPKFWNQICA